VPAPSSAPLTDTPSLPPLAAPESPDHQAEFIESARLFIFETYCRIHQCIDINMLGQRLNMDQEAAEKWIANLILNARLNAKIDSKAGTVVMGVQSQSVQEVLVEKAKGLSARTFTLSNAVGGGGATARA
jgi:translation initiation factor 3 subunit E